MSTLVELRWEELAPYGLADRDKQAFLLPQLEALTRKHHAACGPFREVVDRVFGGLPAGRYGRIEDLPFIPVSLFKERDLVSVPAEAVFKTLTSSGTTGQSVSRVKLDRETADRQARALVKIMQHYLGKERLPMVVLDHPNVVRDRTSFSARGAGVLGMMQFGRQPFYALRDDMSLDRDGLEAYLGRFPDSEVLYFGFTFMAWQHAIRPLLEAGVRAKTRRGILIHSGGWKKLEAAKVTGEEFSRGARTALGVDRVVNFYGMVEQVGSVFFENQLGRLQAPVFADVLVRDPQTLRVLPPGEVGLLQVVSILPGSYPGHSLLTADLGRVLGVDHPDAGGYGRYFEVIGRAPRSELRGCSDTYEQR